MFTSVPLNAAAGLEAPVSGLPRRHPVQVGARLPLMVAARTMALRRVHAVLVCDDDGTPLGWLTAHGMLHNAARDWTGATAADAVTEAVLSVAPDASLHDALEALLAAGASHVLICDEDGGVMGVVSELDLLAQLTAPAGRG